jgi:outer membrane murein-binding lipoprotein Lpp
MINEVIRRTVRKPTGSRLSGAGCPYMNGDCYEMVVDNLHSNVDNLHSNVDNLHSNVDNLLG